MLIGNGALVHRQACRQIGGGAAGDITAWMRSERMNRMVGGFPTIFGGTPSGARPPVTWVLPVKSGALSAYTTVYAEVDVSGTLIPARNIEAAISADVTVSGDLGLIVSAVANLTITANVTADIVGILDAAANITMSTNVTAALGALAGMTAALSTSIDASGNLTGIGSLSADIVSYGELTPEGLRDAVWNALSASYNTNGTMGAKLNSAAAGGVDTGALADAILERNIAGGSDGGRTVQDALRTLRNKVVIDPTNGTITVYAEDDSTVAWTGNITTGARDAINAVDPS